MPNTHSTIWHCLVTCCFTLFYLSLFTFCCEITSAAYFADQQVEANMDAKLQAIFAHVDNNEKVYVERLRQAVAIKSVSAWAETRGDCIKMMQWAQVQLERLGAKTELKKVTEKQVLPDGTELEVPPILFGHLGEDKSKKTVCVYGHLDVQPAVVSDGWDTEPFELTEVDGKFYGRGSTDDKGPVLDWINCIEAYRLTGKELPVNLKFVFEGMEESGSEGLDETIQENLPFFEDVDFNCISDNYWLTTEHPCITYGLRGIAYFFLTVEGAARDLHSGIYGGAVHEAMWDAVAIMDSFVSKDGKIQIEGIYNQVAKLTPEEEALYEPITFNTSVFAQEVGTERLLASDKAKLLQNRWRFPSLSLHGIEGDFSEPGAKTVIPRKVIGKFSMRLVPEMDPKEVERLIKAHVAAIVKERNSPNKISVEMTHGAPAWYGDVSHIQYQAGRKAIKRVWGVEPDMTREGGSIPVALTFEKYTKKNVMLLPIGQSDDGAHSNNEKLSRRNYINGIKVLAAYLEEAAAL